MTEGTQIANRTEEEQMQFLNGLMQTFRDAANAPALRREVEGLRAELATLQKQKQDLEVEIQLERDERSRFANLSHEKDQTIGKLNSQLSSLQHKFDTINGVVASAMAEIEASKPKTTVIEMPKKEPEPWTPSPAQSRPSW